MTIRSTIRALVLLAAAVGILSGTSLVRAQGPGWAVDPASFSESMSIVGQLRLGDSISTDGQDKVAAFAGAELRGVASPSPNGLVFLSVYANSQGDTLTFKAFDADADADGEEVSLLGHQRFTTNCIQGSSAHPFILTDAVGDGADWPKADASTFNATMSVTATLDGGEQAEKVAAFIGNELRGTAEGDLSSTFTMTVYDEASNCSSVEFYAYGAGQQIRANEVLSFQQGGVGSASSPFAMSLPAPLPVELARFEAMPNGQDVLLRWETLSETNNAAFHIEHAADEAAFAHIAQVPGYGTTHTPRQYEHRVGGLAPGRHHFRLRQVDFDGTFSYSPTVEVNLGVAGAFQLTFASPNPFRTTTRFSVQVARSQNVVVAVYDVLGRQVALLHEGNLAAGAPSVFTIDGSTLQGGRYFYRVLGADLHESGTVLLTK